jgi:hypothetical protein
MLNPILEGEALILDCAFLWRFENVGQSLASVETCLAWVTLLVAGPLQALSPASLEHAILTAQFFINQKVGSTW